MPRIAAVLFAAVLVCLAQTAAARNTVLRLSITDVLNGGEFRSKVGPDAIFVFGNSPVPGGARLMGTFSTSKKTNAFNKSDEHACARAFESALLSLHERAVKEGGNAVVNIVSYNEKVPFSSATEYECHAGGMLAGVALQGQVARIGR